jgi:lactoylglutathione lyase
MSVGGFFHGGITVADMDRSLSFYVDGLELEVLVDRVASDAYLAEELALPLESLRIVYLRIPETPVILELLEYRGLERHSAAARPCDPAVAHLGLYVDDVDAVHARLVGMGFRSRSPGPVSITAGPNRGARGVYMFDPDGFYIELFQRPAG